MLVSTRLLVVVIAVLFFAVTAVKAADPTVPLKKGDRIVFLGDSITQGGVSPQGYVILVGRHLEEKQKDLGIEIVGAGISGNKVPDLQSRVERDVISKKPTIVVIYIGINDVWHGQNDPAKGTSKEKFEAGLKELIGKCTDAGAKVVLCTPSVIGEKSDGSNPLDKNLDEYADISRAVAKELKVPLCDLRKAFSEHLKMNNAANKYESVLTTDGVHLNDAGNRVVADTILKTLGQ